QPTWTPLVVTRYRRFRRHRFLPQLLVLLPRAEVIALDVRLGRPSLFFWHAGRAARRNVLGRLCETFASARGREANAAARRCAHAGRLWVFPWKESDKHAPRKTEVVKESLS